MLNPCLLTAYINVYTADIYVNGLYKTRNKVLIAALHLNEGISAQNVVFIQRYTTVHRRGNKSDSWCLPV